VRISIVSNNANKGEFILLAFNPKGLEVPK
jgi:hypothetical protein